MTDYQRNVLQKTKKFLYKETNFLGKQVCFGGRTLPNELLYDNRQAFFVLG